MADYNPPSVKDSSLLGTDDNKVNETMKPKYQTLTTEFDNLHLEEHGSPTSSSDTVSAKTNAVAIDNIQNAIIQPKRSEAELAEWEVRLQTWQEKLLDFKASMESDISAQGEVNGQLEVCFTPELVELIEVWKEMLHTHDTGALRAILKQLAVSAEAEESTESMIDEYIDSIRWRTNVELAMEESSIYDIVSAILDHSLLGKVVKELCIQRSPEEVVRHIFRRVPDYKNLTIGNAIEKLSYLQTMDKLANMRQDRRPERLAAISMDSMLNIPSRRGGVNGPSSSYNSPSSLARGHRSPDMRRRYSLASSTENSSGSVCSGHTINTPSTSSSEFGGSGEHKAGDSQGSRATVPLVPGSFAKPTQASKNRGTATQP